MKATIISERFKSILLAASYIIGDELLAAGLFRKYIVSQLAEHMPFRGYILIDGENRSVIKI